MRDRARARVCHPTVFPPYTSRNGGNHRLVDLSSGGEPRHFPISPVSSVDASADKSASVRPDPGARIPLHPAADNHLSIPMMRFLAGGVLFHDIMVGGGRFH